MKLRHKIVSWCSGAQCHLCLWPPPTSSPNHPSPGTADLILLPGLGRWHMDVRRNHRCAKWQRGALATRYPLSSPSCGHDPARVCITAHKFVQSPEVGHSVPTHLPHLDFVRCCTLTASPHLHALHSLRPQSGAYPRLCCPQLILAILCPELCAATLTDERPACLRSAAGVSRAQAQGQLRHRFQ